MLDLLLLDEMRPFAIAFGIVGGLLALEIVFASIGFTSSIGGDGTPAIDGPEVDTGDLDPGGGAEGDVQADGAAGSAEGAAAAGVGPAGAVGPVGAAASWLGMTKAPVTIWLAGLLTFFGVGGYAVQAALIGLSGSALPPGLVAAAVFVPSVLAARSFARVVGRMVPRFESTAISQRSFGGRRGVVTVGTASEGNPAQVRFTDKHGNLHFVMAEPLRPDTVIPEGAEVAIVRTRSGEPRILQIQ